MRSRSVLFLFALLLLTASLASAATTAGMSTPATDVASSSRSEYEGVWRLLRILVRVGMA